jgi:hypothetical protein
MAIIETGIINPLERIKTFLQTKENKNVKTKNLFEIN